MTVAPTVAEARSASSGGYSRPGFSLPRAPSASGGYARPRTPGISPPSQRTPSPSDQALSRRGAGQALDIFRSRQQAPPSAEFGGPPRTYAPSPRGFATGYDGWRPPAYAYRGPSQFGPWDAVLLWFLLDTLSRPGHAQFFYNHEDDPAYREWRAEADRLAEDNPQLRDKLAQLDRKLAGQAGQPRQPGYLPPDVSRTTQGPATTGGATGLWWVVVVLGGTLILLWRWRQPKATTAGKGGAASPLWTIRNIVSRKISGTPYHPSLFRVGMTLTIDPTPFVLAGRSVKVAPPTADAGQMISVDAVGTVDAEGTTLYRLYLPQGSFFQLHLDGGGQPDECRYFSVVDEITPADPDEWGFWLDPREGTIGWPEFQTKDGKTYGRAWSPGANRIAPARLNETITSGSGAISALSQAMLYAAPSGVPPPGPPTEYILVAAIESQDRAWVRIAAGIDINPALLSLV